MTHFSNGQIKKKAGSDIDDRKPEDYYRNIVNEQQIVKRLSGVGIFGNILLSAFKLLAGILGNSSAMVSDAVHSLSDVFATLIAYIGVRMSRRKEDEEHPYGHERLECVASLILGLILGVTGRCRRDPGTGI